MFKSISLLVCVLLSLIWFSGFNQMKMVLLPSKSGDILQSPLLQMLSITMLSTAVVLNLVFLVNNVDWKLNCVQFCGKLVA